MYVNDVHRRREVPPLWERLDLIRRTYYSLGCPGGERLYQLLRERYYWHGMKRDCLHMCHT